MTHLFVPFRDLTCGTETYLAGRYIDLDRTATGLYNLDFNTAYHPYCYYNTKFDCPYPPSENRLPLPVRAGERMPASAPAPHWSRSSMLQAIVFDFDGVIADSEPLHLRAYQAVLEEDGIELTKEDYYKRYLGFDDEGLFRALAKTRG